MKPGAGESRTVGSKKVAGVEAENDSETHWAVEMESAT